MTVLQITCQPFGIMNALRERFMIPFGLAFLLRVVLFAPKDTFVYKTLGTYAFPPVKPSVLGNARSDQKRPDLSLQIG